MTQSFAARITEQCIQNLETKLPIHLRHANFFLLRPFVPSRTRIELDQLHIRLTVSCVPHIRSSGLSWSSLAFLQDGLGEDDHGVRTAPFVQKQNRMLEPNLPAPSQCIASKVSVHDKWARKCSLAVKRGAVWQIDIDIAIQLRRR